MTHRRPPPRRYWNREAGEWVGVLLWVGGWLWVALVLLMPLELAVLFVAWVFS